MELRGFEPLTGLPAAAERSEDEGGRTRCEQGDGAEGIRTPDLLGVNEALGFELNRNDFVLKWLSLLSAVLRNYALSELSTINVPKSDRPRPLVHDPATRISFYSQARFP